VLAVAFAPAAKRVLTGSADRTARIWDVAADSRPVTDLQLMAEALAGMRIVGSSTLEPLRGGQVIQAWQALRKRYPESLEASPGQLHAWHAEKASLLRAGERWREAIDHLDEALAIAPRRWRLLEERGRAHAELAQWDEAEADAEAALALIPGELRQAYDLTLLHSIRGHRNRLDGVRRRLLARWRRTQNPDRCRWAAQAMVLAPIGDAAARAQTLRWAQTALETEPRHPDRLALYGAALFRAGRLTEAAVELGKARARGVTGPSPSALAFLALAARARGQPAEAARWCNEAEVTLRRRGRVRAVQTDVEAVSAQDGLVAWEQRAQLRVLRAEASCPSAPHHGTVGTGR
jgi:Flp pilus assembly protein TadD